MRRAVRTVLGSLLAFLSGCAGLEPYDRSDTWRARGVNDSNLAAMAVRPADLARGRGTGPADGQIAAAAAERLRYGRVKPLLDGNSGSAPSGAGLTGN